MSARRPPAPIVNLNSRPGPDLTVGDPAHVARCERMAEEFKSFVGIDASETWLEVCVLPQATRRRFAQDAQGWQALAQMLAGQPVPLVVIEATGGLERPAARLLSAADIAVAVVNPRQTRQFAKGLGWLAEDRSPRCPDAGALRNAGAAHRAGAARWGASPPASPRATPASAGTRDQRRGQPSAPRDGAGDPRLAERASRLAEGRAGGARCAHRGGARRPAGGRRARGDPGIGAGGRAGRDECALGAAARARSPRRQGNRCARRPRADRAGFRQAARPALHRRRPCGGALRARHGDVGGEPPQPGDPRLLPAPGRCR